MAWSMRQLADLADTTVKAIRHYHATGVFEEPARAANGYKQYGAAHLVRLLQIKQLRELGMSTAEIRSADASEDMFFDIVRALDARLAASIEREQNTEPTSPSSSPTAPDQTCPSASSPLPTASPGRTGRS